MLSGNAMLILIVCYVIAMSITIAVIRYQQKTSQDRAITKAINKVMKCYDKEQKDNDKSSKL